MPLIQRKVGHNQPQGRHPILSLALAEKRKREKDTNVKQGAADGGVKRGGFQTKFQTIKYPVIIYYAIGKTETLETPYPQAAGTAGGGDIGGSIDDAAETGYLSRTGEPTGVEPGALYKITSLDGPARGGAFSDGDCY